MGRTDNSVTINAGLDLVWSVTNDLNRWPDLFTEYAAVEILNQQGTTRQFRLTMHPDEAGNAWSWVSERTLDEDNHRVTARRIETGWFEFMNITWTYDTIGGRTVMRWIQEFQMRADSPVDDVAMTERINHNTPVQMANIRDQLERIAMVA